MEMEMEMAMTEMAMVVTAMMVMEMAVMEMMRTMRNDENSGNSEGSGR
jgi:hypothetical protein